MDMPGPRYWCTYQRHWANAGAKVVSHWRVPPQGRPHHPNWRATDPSTGGHQPPNWKGTALLFNLVGDLKFWQVGISMVSEDAGWTSSGMPTMCRRVVCFLSCCFLLLPQSSFGYFGFLSTVCELVRALRSEYDPLISKTHLCSGAKWLRAKGALPRSLHVLPRSLFSIPTKTRRTLQLYNKFDVEEERGVRCSCRYVLFLASDP